MSGLAVIDPRVPPDKRLQRALRDLSGFFCMRFSAASGSSRRR